MPDQYSIQEFAAKIRERRPDLANVPDMTLVGKTLAAAPDLKQFLKEEPAPQEQPWYSKYFSQSNSPDRTAAEVMQDQAANVLRGIPKAVTGMPAAIKGTAAAIGDIGNRGPLALAGDLISGTPSSGADAIKGTVAPVVTPAKQAIELAKPGLVDAPTPDSPETAEAAQGAGTALGAAILEGARPHVTAAAKGAWNSIKAKMPPPADAPTLNKWMDVPAKEVSHGANPGQRLVDEGLIGNTKAVTKTNVDTALDGAGKEMQSKLTAADGQGVKINADNLVEDALRSETKKIGAPRDATFQANLQSIEDDILKRYPNLDELTPSQAHALKVDLGDSIKWKGAAYDDPVNQIKVKLYRDLNAVIKSQVKGIAEAQARWGDLYIASKNLAESLSEDTVGKGSGAAPPNRYKAAAKTALKFGLPSAAGAGVGIDIYQRLKGN